MHAAVEHGDPVAVQRLLEAGDASTLTNERDPFLATPLHWACGHGKIECARHLVKGGADMEAEDNEMQHALHYACRYGSDASAAKFLIESRCELNAQDANKRTALHFACSRSSRAGGALDIVRMLLSAGADAAATDKYGDTARACAQKRGHAEIASLLDAHMGGPAEQLMKRSEPPSAAKTASHAASADDASSSSVASPTARLIMATGGSDATALQQALADATKAGVDDAVLIAAVQRLAALQPPQWLPSAAAHAPPLTWTLTAGAALVALVAAASALAYVRMKRGSRA